MRRSTLVFFFGLVVMLGVIARCNSRSRLAQEREQSTFEASPLVPSTAPSPASTATASPTVTPSSTPEVNVAEAAAEIQPAVVSISVFEPSGKLLRTGTGVFVSTNGRILTTRSLMEGGAHAIAKTADDAIYNVNGILTDAQTEDLAVLDADVKQRVKSITPSATATGEEGTPVAVVHSRLTRGKSSIVPATIRKKHKQTRGDFLELSIPVTNEGLGAPVVNPRNEIIGLVTRGPGDPAVVVRTAATLESVLARVPQEGKAKFLAEETPPSPAEGPSPPKVPLAQNPQQGQRSRLIYSPAPMYRPGMARGTGRFRLTFDANGQVRNIMILRSTNNGALDQAAVDAFRKWKAAPGQEWELNVPVTFQ
ncbi:MAG TPA: TonB family protein [Chthoniobacterales bacterium]|nr:TonB family protein [Chthoniobacterales bacterium]